VGLFDEKNWGRKSRDTVPLSNNLQQNSKGTKNTLKKIFLQQHNLLRIVSWFFLIQFLIHSHISWPRSRECEGSRIRTWKCCVSRLVSPSCLSYLSHHIPTEPQYPHWATTFPNSKPQKMISSVTKVSFSTNVWWTMFIIVMGKITCNAFVIFRASIG
jgi:hypothetical protein